MTVAQWRTLKEVERRSKGWPIGIPVNKSMAKRLVSLGYAEWAPPIFTYPKPVYAIRLTTRGKVAIK
jgi:hypothetical protein